MGVSKGTTMNAIYVSVWDDEIRCESACQYNSETKRVSDIEIAANAEDVDNALTDEFVLVLPHFEAGII